MVLEEPDAFPLEYYSMSIKIKQIQFKQLLQSLNCTTSKSKLIFPTSYEILNRQEI